MTAAKPIIAAVTQTATGRQDSPPKDDSQIDEKVWQAWVQRNEARDKVRSARRIKILGVTLSLGIVAALFWRLAS